MWSCSLATDGAWRQIATVHDYDGLIAAIRARSDELQITRETLDDASGLHGGYCGKLLSPIPIKTLGHVSLGPILGALGLALIVVEDLRRSARSAPRLVKRERARAMLPARVLPAESPKARPDLKGNSEWSRDHERAAGVAAHATAAAAIAHIAARARWAKRPISDGRGAARG